jgi:hypothetical protein
MGLERRHEFLVLVLGLHDARHQHAVEEESSNPIPPIELDELLLGAVGGRWSCDAHGGSGSNR